MRTRRKIKELVKENVELKRKKPVLTLAFSNKDQKAKYFLEAPGGGFDDVTDLFVLGTIRAQYPKLKIPKTALQLSNSALKEKTRTKNKNPTEDLANVILAYGELLLQIPVFEYERYNIEIEQFYTNYSRYLDERQSAKKAQSLILECSTELGNNGTAPAEDIDVILELPSEIRFIYPEEFPKEPVQPSSPEPPQPIAVMLGKPVVKKIRTMLSKEPAKSVPLLVSDSNITQPHPDRFYLSNDRQRAIFKLNELKHYYSIPLPKFHVIFNSFEEAKSFEINYQILPRNLPRPIIGKLHIIIEKQLIIPPSLKLGGGFI